MKALLSLSILAALATGALAQTFSAVNDFSTSTNPNGAWRYGSKASSVSGAFILSTQKSNFYFGDGWNASGTPRPFVGLSTADLYDATGPVVFMHPGIAGSEDEYSVLRWVAPSAGTVAINGEFFIGDSGNTDQYVLRNGVSLFSATDTNVANPFSLSSVVAAGDTIDFVLGQASDGPNFDTTPITANIALTSSVPEPATMAILGVGAVALLRRRKK